MAATCRTEATQNGHLSRTTWMWTGTDEAAVCRRFDHRRRPTSAQARRYPAWSDDLHLLQLLIKGESSVQLLHVSLLPVPLATIGVTNLWHKALPCRSWPLTPQIPYSEVSLVATALHLLSWGLTEILTSFVHLGCKANGHWLKKISTAPPTPTTNDYCPRSESPIRLRSTSDRNQLTVPA